MTVRTVADQDRAEGRNEIAAAAVAILAEGDEPITMRSIGGRLGVQASTLYQYVRDKDELLALVVDQVLGPVPAEEGPLPERARALTEHLVRIVSGTPESVRAFRVSPDTTHRAIATRLGCPGADGPPHDALGASLAAAITGLLVWGASRPDDDAARVCSLLRSTVGALLDGDRYPDPTAHPDRGPAEQPRPAGARVGSRVSGSVVPPRRIRFDPVPGAH